MTEHISKQYDQDLEAIRSPDDADGRPGGVADPRRASPATWTATPSAHRAGDRRRRQGERARARHRRRPGQIIVRRQPAASDLRLILAVSKTVTDLERIGDEATKIARMARDIHAERAQAVHRALPMVSHVSEISIGMLRRSLDAFARLDAAAAARVIAEDAAIDEEFRAILRQLITFMMEDPRTISTSHQRRVGRQGVRAHRRPCQEHRRARRSTSSRGRDVRHIPLAELEREALG